MLLREKQGAVLGIRAGKAGLHGLKARRSEQKRNEGVVACFHWAVPFVFGGAGKRSVIRAPLRGARGGKGSRTKRIVPLCRS